MLPIGLPWYWGNMAMYALSYVAVRGESLEGIHTPWIISFYFMFNAVGLFIAGIVSKHTGKQRMILLFGISLFLSGFFMTYYSVYKTVLLMNVTLGVIAGLGGGIIHGMALQYAVGWTGTDLGFVNSLVQSGYNAGSMFINPFITFYVNPDNLSSDLSLGPMSIFSNPDILDNVPVFFIILGSFCIAFFSLGFVMVREPKSYKYYDHGIGIAPDDGEERMELLNGEKKDVTSALSRVSEDQRLKEKELSSGLPKTSNVNLEYAETIIKTPASAGDSDKHPIEMIKTRTFLTLWISLMMYDNAMLVLANYYKEFGATCIHDDHFLTFLGTVLNSTTILAFPFWGFLTDRIGVKRTLISMYSISSILCFLMFFTPRISRLLYMLNIASLGSFLTPIYSILITATCKIFGKTHYSSNIGLVASLSLLCNFVNPLIFEAILSMGWFYIFCYGGCLTGTALVFIVLTLPDT